MPFKVHDISFLMYLPSCFMLSYIFVYYLVYFQNYGYREDDGEETVKVRGFRLNYINLKSINFNSIKEMLEDRGRSLYVTDSKHIQRNRTSYNITSVEQRKKYSIVYTKRKILEDLDTLPYGY